MSGEWLRHTILRTASLLAPREERAEWLAEWRSELWYIPRRGSTLFCLGAFADALWLRRNSPGADKRSAMHLESPLRCLVLLAAMAALCGLIAVYLPAPKTMKSAAHLKFGDLPRSCLDMLLIACVFLTAIRLAMGRAAAGSRPVTWRDKLRLGVFLALKIVLVQPILLCGFLASNVIPVGSLALWVFWALPCRWVLMDQRRRCPVCLRLLADPVRIGSPSETFLQWYGAESVCSRGHGLLHVAEMPSSYTEGPEWLCLGESWKELFSVER